MAKLGYLALSILLVIQIITTIFLVPKFNADLTEQKQMQINLKEEYLDVSLELDKKRNLEISKLLLDNFTDSQIKEILRSQIKTSLEINNEKINGNKRVINVSENNVRIKITESYVDTKLPSECVKLGGILMEDENIEGKIDVFTTFSEYEFKRIKKLNYTVLEFKADGLSSGEIVSIYIRDEELKKRLDLDNGLIEVIYAFTKD